RRGARLPRLEEMDPRREADSLALDPTRRFGGDHCGDDRVSMDSFPELRGGNALAVLFDGTHWIAFFIRDHAKPEDRFLHRGSVLSGLYLSLYDPADRLEELGG